MVTTNKKITDLQDEIEQYNSPEQHIKGELPNPLPSILVEMATQLQNDTETFDDNTPKQQLKDIAQLVSNFIEAYNKNNQDVTESNIDENEEIEEGEEIEENKLNNSAPNIKVKGIFDEDDVLAENWYGNEAEDRDDNIDAEGNCKEINYDNLDAKSQSEESLHLSKDNEGTGKDLNADTNTEHNPQTNNANNEHKKNSITTEGKQDPNTIKVEEDPTAANEQANAPQEAKTNPNLPENNDGQNEENTENYINNTKKDGNETNQLKEEKERAEKIEQLKEEVNAYFNKNKETDSKLTTTQKIINNLSATNNMLQIIKQILCYTRQKQRNSQQFCEKAITKVVGCLHVKTKHKGAPHLIKTSKRGIIKYRKNLRHTK